MKNLMKNKHFFKKYNMNKIKLLSLFKSLKLSINFCKSNKSIFKK